MRLAENRIGGDGGYSAVHEKLVHRTIRKVGEDIENMKFNTAIAAMMSLVNAFYETKPNRAEIRTLLTLLSPFAPHIAEELWEIQGFEGLACQAQWPEYDEAKTVDADREIAVQVGGKLKTTVTVPADCDDATAIAAATSDEKIRRLMEGKQLVRTIVVKNKLVNLILK